MAEAQPYAVAPTREGIEGLKDKAAIMNALAKRVAEYDREFVNFVRAIVAPFGNSSESQAAAWAAHCKALPYHREHGEIFAHPREVLASGGDCDDLTLLALAGFHTLAIPCCPDIVTRGNEGIHVRARVGLPPTNPPTDLTLWLVFDPVEDSEREWAMVPPGAQPPKLGKSEGIAGTAVLTGLAGDIAGTTETGAAASTVTKTAGMGFMAFVAMVAFVGVVFTMSSSKQPQR